MNGTQTNLIIGGNSRIGQACARRFSRRAGTLLVASRNNLRLRDWIADHSAGPSKIVPVELDIRDAAQVEACFRFIEEKYGRLDYLFNNAGVLRRKPLEGHSEDDWSATLDTNVIGMWRCIKHAVPLMASGGAIVNMASVSGLSGTDWGLSAYIASKFAVVGLTKAAALEFANRGIRVNAVCPGVVQTDMTNVLLTNDTEQFYSRLHPLGRVAQPDEVAAAVEWLCSPEASFITGAAIPIDGGLMARAM